MEPIVFKVRPHISAGWFLFFLINSTVFAVCLIFLGSTLFTEVPDNFWTSPFVDRVVVIFGLTLLLETLIVVCWIVYRNQHQLSIGLYPSTESSFASYQITKKGEVMEAKQMGNDQFYLVIVTDRFIKKSFSGVRAYVLLKTDYQDPYLTTTVLGVKGYVLMKEDVIETKSIEGKMENLFDRLKLKLRDHLVVVSEEDIEEK